MRIGSLFSGAGGLDMAVEEVFGGEVIWQAEVDKAASKVLAYRFPCAPNLGDITQIDWKTVEPVDVICGGYPCQPFSQAGQRQGTNDERHLWPYFAEAIRRIRPSYAVLENVAGHRSMGFDSVLADLATSGYDAQWCSLRASEVGAPHRRERLFVLAIDTRDRDQSGAKPQVFSNLHDRAVNDLCGVALLPTPTCQDGANTAGPSQFDRNSLPLNTVATLLPTPSLSDTKTPRRGEQLTATIASGIHTLNLSDAIEHQHGRDSVHQAWGKYEPAIRRWEALTRPAPAPTEPNKNGNPRLSAAFSEWMMGWPHYWVTDPDIGISRNDQLKIVGNGVCPQQAAAALRYLLTVAEAVA